MIRHLLLALSLLALVACGGDTFEQYIARANDAVAKSEYPAAIIELKNALKLQPDSSQARWLLAKVYLDSGDLPSAEKELQQALVRGWSQEEVTPALAEALLAQGKYAEVRDIIVSGLAPDTKAKVLALQAQAALGLNDTAAAEGLIDKALIEMPESTKALIAKGRILASKQDMAGATATLDKVLALDAEQGEAWSLRGDILARQGNAKDALAAYDKSINLRHGEASDLFKRAYLNLQLGDFEASQRDTEVLLYKAKTHPGANYIQGLLHFEAGRYAEAITSLSVVEPASKQYPLALFYLAAANMKQDSMAQAATLAERFYSAVPGSVQGRKLLAAIRLEQGDWTAVQALLQPVLERFPDDVGTLNLITNALLHEGKTDEAIALLSRLAELQPESPGAQIRLGAGLLLEGNSDAAVAHIETALELKPEYELADMLLVNSYLQKRDFPAAIAAAKAYQNNHNTSITPYYVLGKVYLEAGNRELALEAFRSALTMDKADPAANHYLAQIAVAENDLSGARKLYETALAGHPNSAATLMQLALLDAREGHETALVAHLEQAGKADPAALPPRLLLARYYLGRGKAEQVAPLFLNLDARQQQEPEVLRLLAMAQLSTGDSSAAQLTLGQLLKTTPDSAPIRHAMAMAATDAGDTRRAMTELRNALALDENFLLSRIALARMALEPQSTAEFTRQLEKLTALAPNNPDVLLLQAAAAQGRGDTRGARSLAATAFQLAPSTGTVVSLGTFEEIAGDRDSALKRYAAWLQDHPDDSTTRMAYANSLQAAQRLDDAAQQYAAVLQADPENPMALNNQAWIMRDKNPAQALTYAKKAAERAPDSADVLDTLAVVEYTNKDYRSAERHIERALRASPEHPSLLYHSAMIAVALDDDATARATLKKLLATSPVFPEIEQAKALLAQLDQ